MRQRPTIHALSLLLFCLTAVAQTPGTSQPGFTLSTTTRLVITDVTVTDAQGHPVHGLKQSSFTIAEDGRQEEIRAFDEQQRSAAALPTVAVLPHGAYSNVAVGQLPQTTNVILIDPFNTDLTDQMYLRIQLLKYLKRFQGKDAVAIFAVNSGHSALLLQDFTSDPNLLRAAVVHELPRLTANGGNRIEHFDDAMNTLATISAYLSRIPGHKNLIWYSTYFPFTQNRDGFLSSDGSQEQQELVHIYNQLSLDRVSVYPIDAVGPDPTSRPPIGQEAAMEQIAHVTGGQAYYNRNDLGTVAELAFDSGSEYYTLSYAPRSYVADNKFHKITVNVAGGPYTLHYRTGYVAFDLKDDASSTLDGKRLAETNADLDKVAAGQKLPGGKGNASTDSLTDYNAPGPALASILFEARIVPAAQVPGWQVLPLARDSRGKVIGNPHDEPFVIEYAALSKDLHFVPTPEGKQHAELIAAAMAYTDTGEVIGTAIDRVQLNYDARQMQLADRIGTPLRQQIRLPRGEAFVSLSLIDNISGHTGSLEIPFQVAKP